MIKKLQKKSRNFAILLVSSFLLGNIPVYANENTNNSNTGSYTDHVILMVDSTEIYHNGELFTSNYPQTIREGVTYISLRALAQRLGLNISFDPVTKETTLGNRENELRFFVNQATYNVNGKSMTSTHGIPFIENETLMVPLRVFVTHFNIQTVPEVTENKIHLYWSTKPSAEFSVSPAKVYAQQTKVEYLDKYKHPMGLPMGDEIWEGKMETFPQAGTYTVRRWVYDQNGVLSNPFEVKIQVVPPNQPPVAVFATNKSTYKIGEPIIYHDYSYDDENAIAKTTWTNQMPAFFTAGEQTIGLEVEDVHGLKSRVERTIVIEDEILYTSEDFYPWFTPVGEKFFISGGTVPSIPKTSYRISNEEYTLFRSNSPEVVREEGIYYQDILQGKIRVLIHNESRTDNVMRIYLVATNPNEEKMEVKIPYVGLAGPHDYVTTAGKAATARYLAALSNPSQTVVTLEPGESKIIIPEMGQRNLFNKQTLSMYADLVTELPLHLQTVVVSRDKDVMQAIPYLPQLASDGIHKRGTFEYANRTITIPEPIGHEKTRIAFGDRDEDVKISGVDLTSGETVINEGNFGVLYKVKLERVAPRSLILLNPRGGEYSGAFLVNGKLVTVTEKSHLLNANEVGVLHRIGDYEESVEIVFIPASGSNLPINFVVQPLPEKKH